MNASERARTIEQRLSQHLAPSFLDVIDESDQHIGHAGAATGLSHFHVIIAADSLTGLTRIAQHRRINELLADLFSTDIHALRITVQK